MEVKNNNNNSILEIDDLEVIYKTDLETVKAVNGINLKIRKGETCGLVGETGAAWAVINCPLPQPISR